MLIGEISFMKNIQDIAVTVICTAYNHENYIKTALDGFVMQKTNFSFEVLVHDDASTDKTADIIREYAEKYPDIIVPVIQTENQYSKNVRITNDILLPMARGKYIAFCEGDDFWTNEDKLQIQYDFLESHFDYIACVHNTTMHYCLNKGKDKIFSLRQKECDIEFKDAIKKMQYQTSSLFVRKEYFCKLPKFYYSAIKSGVGDFPRAIYYTIIGKIRFLPYNMSTYRVASGPDSWSRKISTSLEKKFNYSQNIIEMYEGVKEYVDDEKKKLVDEVILRQKFTGLEAFKRYDEMKKEPYISLWKKSSLMFKIKIFFKKRFKRTYEKYVEMRDISK